MACVGFQYMAGSPSACSSCARAGICAGAHPASYVEGGCGEPFSAPNEAGALSLAHHSTGAGLYLVWGTDVGAVQRRPAAHGPPFQGRCWACQGAGGRCAGGGHGRYLEWLVRGP